MSIFHTQFNVITCTLKLIDHSEILLFYFSNFHTLQSRPTGQTGPFGKPAEHMFDTPVLHNIHISVLKQIHHLADLTNALIPLWVLHWTSYEDSNALNHIQKELLPAGP